MRTIHKYVVGSTATVSMPRGATVLTIQAQRDVPCIWAEVDTTQPLEDRRFIIFGTGHEMPADASLTYLGTFQLDGGALVFHVYEEDK